MKYILLDDFLDRKKGDIIESQKKDSLNYFTFYMGSNLIHYFVDDNNLDKKIFGKQISYEDNLFEGVEIFLIPKNDKNIYTEYFKIILTDENYKPDENYYFNSVSKAKNFIYDTNNIIIRDLKENYPIHSFVRCLKDNKIYKITNPFNIYTPDMILLDSHNRFLFTGVDDKGEWCSVVVFDNGVYADSATNY
jgi:hypothetical protein